MAGVIWQLIEVPDGPTGDGNGELSIAALYSSISMNWRAKRRLRLLAVGQSRHHQPRRVLGYH